MHDLASDGRAQMALERVVSLSEGSWGPKWDNWFSQNRLHGNDLPRYAQTNTAAMRTMLDRLLCGPKAALGLEELRRVGGLEFFEHVHPIVGFGGGSQGHKDLWDHTKKVVEQSVPRAEVRWSALFHDVGKVRTFGRHDGKIGFHGHELLGSKMFVNFARKTAIFSTREEERIRDVVLHLGRVESFEGEWTDSAVRRLIVDLGDCLEDVISLSSADITTCKDAKRAAILRNIGVLVKRIEAVRAEDALPHLPKGLGLVLSERLGIPRSRELGAVMEVLGERLRSGAIPPDTDVDGYVEIVRKARG